MNCRFSSSSVDWRIGSVGLRKMIAPFLVQLHELVELRLKIIHGFGGVPFSSCRNQISHRPAVRRDRALAAVSLVVADRIFRAFPCPRQSTSSSTGFCCKFLFDERLEFERRRLQQRQRLLQLRRQHQRLRQPLATVADPECHLRSSLTQIPAEHK